MVTRLSRATDSSPALHKPSLTRWVALAALCIVPAACSSSGSLNESDTGDTAAYAAHDPAAEIGYWRQRYKDDPKNKTAGTNYARSLRQIGERGEALTIALAMLTQYPDDPRVRGEYASILLVNGRAKEAASVLERLRKEGAVDWRGLNTLGVAYDTLDQHERAADAYLAALALTPNNSAVLNNFALSEAMSGNLERAESRLREAMRNGAQDDKVYLNLALVLGLQGRFDEAETMAQATLPPSQVASNIAYLKNLMRQPDRWGALRALDSEGETPNLRGARP